MVVTESVTILDGGRKVVDVLIKDARPITDEVVSKLREFVRPMKGRLYENEPTKFGPYNPNPTEKANVKIELVPPIVLSRYLKYVRPMLRWGASFFGYSNFVEVYDIGGSNVLIRHDDLHGRNSSVRQVVAYASLLAASK